MRIRGTWSAGPGDDQARFLADLRALRDSAAIGYDELAARAHYPSDILKEAENGPSLPGLPILTAYVRACEGDALDWEERWRRLNPDVADDPGLPVRPTGASAAAVAGARAGVSIAPPDVYDPERIKAALRGGQARPEQASRRVSDPGVSIAARARDDACPERRDQDQHAGWGGGSGWDAPADPGLTSANGKHPADHGNRGPFDASLTGILNPTEPGQAEKFSWLKKSAPEPRPADGEPTWREQTPGGFGWTERADAGPSPMPTAGPAAPEPAVSEQAPWRQLDGVTAGERTDFWSKPVTPVSSDPQRPAAAPRADEPAGARASWSAPPDTATGSAHRVTPDAGAIVSAGPTGSSGLSGSSGSSGLSGLSGSSGVPGSAQPPSQARSTTQTFTSDRGDRRKSRMFPVRLLMIIVIAALIGSVLILLLK